MNMRIKSIATGLVLGVLALTASTARAATTNLVVKGTTVNLSLATSLPGATEGCTIDVWLVLSASSSVAHSTGTAGAGAYGFVQRVDNCAGTFEFGSFDQALTSGFSTAPRSATLATTIPVLLQNFNTGATATRSLVLNLQFQDTPGDTIASFSHGMTRAPSFKLITNGHSVYRLATMTGALTLDGVSLINAGEVSQASIETSTSLTVTISR
jgi:hypothetical protein